MNLNAETTRKYVRIMADFMSYKDNVRYRRDQTFTREQLLGIKPETIAKYMYKKAYDNDSPVQANAPLFARSSTLEMCKKAISNFMLSRTGCWNEESQSGNPTRSKEVNDVLKCVQKQEVRRMGRPSQAKRALTMTEFRASLFMLNDNFADFIHRYRLPTMMKYQYHMIARSDDLGHILIRDLKVHSNPSFQSFVLETEIHWSKNILTEKDCPCQILFASMDCDYCLLLALACYLEIWFSIESQNYGRGKKLLFSDEIDIINAPFRLKRLYCSTLRTQVFDCPDFLERAGTSIDDAATLGSHSLRKYPATFARSNGMTPDDIDIRGRWKPNEGRVVQRYISVKQEYIDAKVAAVLCVGGPIKYCLVADSGVTKDFLYQHVVPGIHTFFGLNNPIADVLALPLLWAVMDQNYNRQLPPALVTRISTAYASIRTLAVDVNPVEKIRLHVYSAEGTLRISEFHLVNNENAQHNNSNGQMTSQILLQQELMVTQINSVRDELTVNLATIRTDIADKFRMINSNMNRIIIQPSRRATPRQIEEITERQNLEVARDAPQEPLFIPGLSKLPKSLYDLWIEYVLGIGGRKPAKDFTPQERGKFKCTYCRRKVFWDIVSRHVNGGIVSAVAIDLIYQCYGRKLSVTKILTKLITDKKTGGHPNLQL